MVSVEVINKLISHWKKNDILYSTGVELKGTLVNTDIILPTDFQELYKKVNGTIDCDNEGFLFYRWQDLLTMGEKFSLAQNDDFYKVVIFIDYMQASWWYGVSIEGNNYEIGIIANEKRFKPITNSLNTFIDLYIDDSEILYDYGGL